MATWNWPLDMPRTWPISARSYGLIVIGELHVAAEVVDCLDALVRDSMPTGLRRALVSRT